MFFSPNKAPNRTSLKYRRTVSGTSADSGAVLSIPGFQRGLTDPVTSEKPIFDAWQRPYILFAPHLWSPFFHKMFMSLNIIVVSANPINESIVMKHCISIQSLIKKFNNKCTPATCQGYGEYDVRSAM